MSTDHSFGKIVDTLQILDFQQKGLFFSALEKDCIYKTKRTGNLLNNVYNDVYNPITEFLAGPPEPLSSPHSQAAVVHMSACTLPEVSSYSTIN